MGTLLAEAVRVAARALDVWVGVLDDNAHGSTALRQGREPGATDAVAAGHSAAAHEAGPARVRGRPAPPASGPARGWGGAPYGGGQEPPGVVTSDKIPHFSFLGRLE